MFIMNKHDKVLDFYVLLSPNLINLTDIEVLNIWLCNLFVMNFWLSLEVTVLVGIKVKCPARLFLCFVKGLVTLPHPPAPGAWLLAILWLFFLTGSISDSFIFRQNF